MTGIFNSVRPKRRDQQQHAATHLERRDADAEEGDDVQPRQAALRLPRHRRISGPKGLVDSRHPQPRICQQGLERGCKDQGGIIRVVAAPEQGIEPIKYLTGLYYHGYIRPAGSSA